MCHSVRFLAMVMILAETNCDSTEDQHSYTLNGIYAPSTLTFHDVFTNNAPTAVTEEDATSTTEDVNINSIQTQFVEFHPRLTTEIPTIPPPKYILNSNFLQEATVLPIPTTSTTEDPEDVIKVVPIKRVYQRGVLDLLFPPSRVKAFKNVFDSIRRVLSHTFRR